MQPEEDCDFETSGECDTIRRRKYAKKKQNVSFEQLGFRPKIAYDVIDPRNVQRVVRRRKPKYSQLNSKQNFLSRLRMVVNAQHLPEGMQSDQFHVSKLGDWQWVRKVFYRSREKVYCSICLDERIVAPQITFCGHIFCFHCILMHFKKSQNSAVCPVCKEFTAETQLKPCQSLADRDLTVSDQISLSLKFRIGRNIYDSETLIEDLNFQQIIRMRTKGVLSIYEAEHGELQQQLKNTEKTDRTYSYLEQAIKICSGRIEKTRQIMVNKSQHVKLRENQRLKQDTILRTMENIGSDRLQQAFYQEQSGRFIFLHQICKKYLPDHSELPKLITARIMEKEETWYGDRIADYKHLSHLNPSTEIDLVMISLEGLVGQQANKQFERQFKEYLRKKHEIEVREEEKAEIMNRKYEEEVKNRNRYKELDAAQFQIRVPTDLHPSDHNEQSFPSLIGKTEERERDQNLQDFSNVPSIKRKKTQQPQMEDFPELSYMKQSRSQAPKQKQQNGKRGKRRKEKKVDVTHLIFAGHEEDDY